MATQQYNFSIQADNKVSQMFLARGVNDFAHAMEYVRDLPYGRNANKSDLLRVFTDGCGTCSTKHALLKQLADENKIGGIQLILCMFKMNAINTPPVKMVLEQYGLAYIPEAHNYLKVQGEVVDRTKAVWSLNNYPGDILSETEITPEQITDFKVNYHKAFLADWLKANSEIKYSLQEMWEIREECIRSLSN